MSKLNLNVKLKDVRKYEEGGFPLNVGLSKGIVGICDFLSACGKTDEEVEAALKEYGPDELTYMVMTELQDAGFLSKAIDAKLLKEKGEEQMRNQLQKLMES